MTTSHNIIQNEASRTPSTSTSWPATRSNSSRTRRNIVPVHREWHLTFQKLRNPEALLPVLFAPFHKPHLSGKNVYMPVSGYAALRGLY